MDFDLTTSMTRLSIQFVPFLIAVVFHEWAHGYMAKRWGDPTAEDAGRITLNPVAHVDPVGTVVLPIMMMFSGVSFLFGWAKPVPINPRRFKKYRQGLFWVSFAGPLMNFTLATLSALIFAMIAVFVPESFEFKMPMIQMAQASVFMNLALGVFNMVPLPPLDGSKMVESFLSIKATLQYENLARYSFFILLALMFTGAFRYIFTPVMIAGEFLLRLALYAFGIVA